MEIHIENSTWFLSCNVEMEFTKSIYAKMCHENNEFNYILNASNYFIHQIQFIFRLFHFCYFLFFFFLTVYYFYYSFVSFFFLFNTQIIVRNVLLSKWKILCKRARKFPVGTTCVYKRCCSQCCFFRDNHWIWCGSHVWDSSKSFLLQSLHCAHHIIHKIYPYSPT